MIVYEIVNRKHKITDVKCPPDFDPRIKRWWRSVELSYCNHAVIAFEKTRGKKVLIGFLRFAKNNKHFYADGTYVLPVYRSKKISKKLWHHAIKFAKPTYVEVMTATRGGMRLIASLVRKYTKIDWYVYRKFHRN